MSPAGIRRAQPTSAWASAVRGSCLDLDLTRLPWRVEEWVLDLRVSMEVGTNKERTNTTLLYNYEKIGNKQTKHPQLLLTGFLRCPEQCILCLFLSVSAGTEGRVCEPSAVGEIPGPLGPVTVKLALQMSERPLVDFLFFLFWP